ncbi:MAG: 16S rRNA (uracil(1498)-N(3))-methyltransferase [Rubrobacteraceae bacterium]|nr:16S rRNA (uracil(1498)-N(3))-methyltransferase [Rubrobacteraceae bacterium]
MPREEAHHVFRVLRARRGDAIEVVDSRRRLFLATLLGEDRAEISEPLHAGEPARGVVRIYQAVPKGGHMDLLVEKATELGADEIVPVLSERVLVGAGAARRRLARWRRIAVSAARQSLQLRVPRVREPLRFPEAVREVRDGVLLHNVGRHAPIEWPVAKGGEANLFVGPEGGWSEEEVEAARRGGLTLASLGPYRLRSETAGVVAVARARAAMDLAGPSGGENGNCEV